MLRSVAAAALVATTAALLASSWRWRHQRKRCQERTPRLEVCADGVAACLAAQAGGADRVELCDNLVEGGTTPSVGKLVCCRRHCKLPIHVMLRPRGGEFLYTTAELEVMHADLDALKAAGADGVVVGVLHADGRVDEALLSQFVRRASPLPVTFHRAIDVTPDPVAALHACARCGVARVLTSGGQPTAMLGRAMIQQLVATITKEGYPIVLAAGGGVTDQNAAAILRETGAPELHASARDAVSSTMGFRPEPPIFMGGEKTNGPNSEFEWRCTSAAKVEGIRGAMLSLVGRPRAPEASGHSGSR